MRISSIEQFQQGIDSILNQQAKLNQTQLQLATGKKVLKPSDDPAVATQLLNLSSLKANNLQYDRNINTAQNELELQESVLASSGNVLQRVRELVIQANNATQSSQTREAIADEISNLADELLQLANTKVRRVSIFSRVTIAARRRLRKAARAISTRAIKASGCCRSRKTPNWRCVITVPMCFRA